MSQAGKVLHLYVEVRSVAEEEGKVPGRGDDGSSHLMLQCPDVLPHSQRSSAYSSRNPSPDLSPIQHHMGGENHSLPLSKTSSRQSVNFRSNAQLQEDALHDRFGQLLEVLTPGMTVPRHHGSLGHICSSDMDPHQRRVFISPSSTSSGRLTVPSTPVSGRRYCEVPGVEGNEGRKSVVSFSYIEKANVHNTAARRNSLSHNEPDSPFKEMGSRKVLPAHLRKRLSDPMSYNGYLSQSHTCPAQSPAPRGSPYLQRANLDSVARGATYRALEEFGSPELMRRFGGHRFENSSPSLPRHYQPSRCQSWGGSPDLPRSTLTLPCKTQLMELDRTLSRSPVNGLPRSPASNHLCAHTSCWSYSADPAAKLHSNGPTQSKPRPWMGDENPRHSSKFHPPLPAGRPTDIQHEVQTNVLPASTSCTPGTSHHSAHNANTTNTSQKATDGIDSSSSNKLNLTSRSPYRLSRCSRASDAASDVSGRRSASPSSNLDVASKLALEASRLSSIFAERRTPTPPESFRPESPKTARKESQPYSALYGRSSPELLQVDPWNHSRKTDKEVPHTKPGRISPVSSQKGLSSPASPAMPARLYRAAASQSPELDPRQKRSASPTKDMSSLHRYQPPQYTGDHRSPGVERRQYDHLSERSPRDSPEITRKPVSRPTVEALPVSWTSRQQEWMEDRSELKENYRQAPPRVYVSHKDESREKDGGDKGVKTSGQEQQRLGVGVTKDQTEDVQDHSGGAGPSSHSSSGVTGSLRDSLSPETSSQSSHDMADGGSGMQVGWMGGGGGCGCVRGGHQVECVLSQ